MHRGLERFLPSIGVSIFTFFVGMLVYFFPNKDIMGFLVMLLSGATIVVILLLSILGMQLIRIAIDDIQWGRRDVEDYDTSYWHKRRHHAISSKDILWTPQWYVLLRELQELEAKWFEHCARLNLSNTQSHEDFLLEKWRIQGEMASIEEAFFEKKAKTLSVSSSLLKVEAQKPLQTVVRAA